MPEEVPIDIVEEVVGVPESSLPTNDLMHNLTKNAVELMEVVNDIERLEQIIKDKADRRRKLSEKILPEMMDQAMVDRIGIPGMLSDVVMEHYYHANISAQWPEEQREAAFQVLEDIGGGELVKNVVSVTFNKGEVDLANAFVEYVRRWNGLQGRQIKQEKSVPWATLTSFVKHAFLNGERAVLNNLDSIGGTIARRCRVIPRKTRNPKLGGRDYE